MKRALNLGLVLLAGSAAGAQIALALGPGAAQTGAGALFFVGGPTSTHPQGYLGVDVRDVTADQATALKLKDPRGAEIVLVDHDAPAGKAGLREHDVVLQMNGQAIAGEDQIRKMLRETAPGKTVILVISRDGLQMTVSAQMANREEVERQAWEQHLTVPEPQVLPSPAPESDSSSGFAPAASSTTSPAMHGNSFIGTILMSPAYTGALLEKMSTQLADYFGASGGAGLLVRSVEANSPAALAGMRAGDVVVRANSQTVASTNDWTRAIKNSRGHPFPVVVLRDKKEQTLTLTPDAKKRSSLESPQADREANASTHLGLSWIYALQGQ
jgi:S1-C subfamily serine protease